MKHRKLIHKQLTLKKALRYATIFAIVLQFIFVWLSVGFMDGRSVEIDEEFLNEADVQLETKAFMLMEDLKEETIDGLNEPVEDSEIEMDDNLAIDHDEPEQVDDVEPETEMPNIEVQSSSASIRVHQMQGRYDYLSGEIIHFHAGATLDGIFPAGTVFEIRIPRLHIMDENPNTPNAAFQVSAIPGQTPPTITRTDNATTGEFVIRYTLNTAAGALEFDALIEMAAHNGHTPNGFEIPITARLIDVADNSLADDVGTTFTINTVTPEVTKRVFTHDQTGWGWSTVDNVLVSNSGLESMTHSGYFSEDLRELALVSFTYWVNSPGTLGNRVYQSLVFYDQIPDEALFVQSVNPGWTFDEDTRIARFEHTVQTVLGQIGYGNSLPGQVFNPNLPTQLLHNHAPILRLYFPGAPINTTFTGEVRVVGTGQGTNCETMPSDCFEVIDELNFRLGADTRRFNGAITKTPTQATTGTNNVPVRGNAVLGNNTRDIETNDDTRNYTINVGHTVNSPFFNHLPLLPLENVVIRDHNLDPALYFRGITILARSADRFSGTLEVSVLLADGTTVVLADDLSITTAQHIDFSTFDFHPEDVTEFFIESTEGSFILPSGVHQLQIMVHTGPRDPTEAIIPASQTERAFINDVTLTRNGLNHSTTSSNARGTLAYRLENLLVGIQHEPTQRRHPTVTSPPEPSTNITFEENHYVIGETRHFNLRVNMVYVLNGDVVETEKILVLLPDGFEFIPGSVELHISNNIQTHMTATDLNAGMEVIEDFQGTGQTALIFPLQPFTSITNNAGTLAMPMNAFTIVYETLVTEETVPAIHTNVAHLLWLNRDEVRPGVLPQHNHLNTAVDWAQRRYIVPDRFDLAGTGATDEMLSEGQARVDVIRPLELLVFKEVRGNMDSNFLTYPAIGTSELGSYVDYRLRLLNNTAEDIHPNHFQVVDILPHAGDGRGSTFTPTLAGSITTPTGYRVYYTTDAVDPTVSIIAFTENANWVTSVANYADVTAIKFEMNAEHVLERESQVTFDFRLNLRNDPSFTTYDRVVNTFYTSTNGGVSYILSNEAHLSLFEATIDGYVFQDLDGNGVLDHDVDSVLANHQVGLIKQTEMGYETVDTTMTDERGFYSFNTMHPGHYFISVYAPNGLTHITHNIGGAYGANAFNPTTALSERFTLDVTNTHQRINAGFEEVITPPITGLSNHTLLSVGLLLSMLVIGTVYVTLRVKKYSEQHRIES